LGAHLEGPKLNDIKKKSVNIGRDKFLEEMGEHGEPVIFEFSAIFERCKEIFGETFKDGVAKPNAMFLEGRILGGPVSSGEVFIFLERLESFDEKAFS
jgi:hypothetical protein